MNYQEIDSKIIIDAGNKSKVFIFIWLIIMVFIFGASYNSDDKTKLAFFFIAPMFITVSLYFIMLIFRCVVFDNLNRSFKVYIKVSFNKILIKKVNFDKIINIQTRLGNEVSYKTGVPTIVINPYSLYLITKRSRIIYIGSTDDYNEIKQINRKLFNYIKCEKSSEIRKKGKNSSVLKKIVNFVIFSILFILYTYLFLLVFGKV